MNGVWPRAHAIQTYKLFISEYLLGTLLINMLKVMDSYLQCNVFKELKPDTLGKQLRWRGEFSTSPNPKYHRHWLPNQFRHRTLRQLPRPYMYPHQRQEQCIWTQCARRVRIRAPSSSEPTIKVSEAFYKSGCHPGVTAQAIATEVHH